MIRKLNFILFFILICTISKAQKKVISLHADGGLSRTYLPYEDIYASPYQRYHSTAGISISTCIQLADWLTFDPEIGLDAYGMRFFYYNHVVTQRKVDSNLLLGYGRISPMLSVWPHRQFGISGGFSVLASAFTLGNFGFWTFNNGWSRTLDYGGNLGSIRNTVIWGPAASLGLKFPTFAGRTVGISFGSFWSLNRIFAKSLDTPFNPRLFRLVFRVSYSITKGK